MEKKPQLFLLHFAGGNYYSFRPLLSLFPDFSTIPLELPGRGDRAGELLLTDIEAASKDYFKQIMNHVNGEAFVLFGHSMGALLGLKVAELLEANQMPPTCVFVSGHHGPSPDNINRKRYLFNDEDLIEELKRLEGVPQEVLANREFLEYYLPIIRADFEVTEKTPHFEAHINRPIIAMMGEDEANVNKIANWGNFTSANFDYQLFSGGHFFIFEHPQAIAKMIVSCFRQNMV